MSYCRWSSDDWQSDLYVYEGADGVWIHVANRRRGPEFVAALPPSVPMDPSNDVAWQAWADRHRVVMDMLDKYPLEDLDLPHAGTDARFDTHHEAADAVVWLAAVGFHVPDGVVESLREDAQFPGATA